MDFFLDRKSAKISKERLRTFFFDDNSAKISKMRWRTLFSDRNVEIASVNFLFRSKNLQKFHKNVCNLSANFFTKFSSPLKVRRLFTIKN